MTLFGVIVFFLISFGFLLWAVISAMASKKLITNRGHQWKFNLIGTIFSTVFGLAIFLTFFWLAFSYPGIVQDNNNYAQWCADSGGVVLDLENSGLECWSNKIGEQ